MRDSGIISQSLTKRTTAAALADRVRANNWSNSDAGDVLGISEGTIRNRLDGDEPSKQMTVHELARSVKYDGPAMANAILSKLVGFHLERDERESAAEALDLTADGAQCAAALLAMSPELSPADRRALLAKVINIKITLGGVEALLRADGAPLREVATG
jgi:hypothetical protein